MPNPNPEALTSPVQLVARVLLVASEHTPEHERLAKAQQVVADAIAYGRALGATERP